MDTFKVPTELRNAKRFKWGRSATIPHSEAKLPLAQRCGSATEPKVPLAQRDDTLGSATIVMYTQTYFVSSEPKVSVVALPPIAYCIKLINNVSNKI